MLLNQGFTKALPTIAEHLDESGTNESGVAIEQEGGLRCRSRTQRVLLNDLGDIYDAEHRFLEGQQRMVQEATDQRLRRAIQEHTEQTQQQSQNLDQAFRELGQEPRRQPCDASIGLAREAKRTTSSGRSATGS